VPVAEALVEKTQRHEFLIPIPRQTDTTMDKKKENHNEPYRPEDTPTPPQNMNPGKPGDERKPDQEPKAEKRKAADKDKDPNKKLLGESPIEIDDETTI